jgi:RNA recognition motif-containing protein
MGNDLRQIFEIFGQVRSLTVAIDPTTGTSRGFAFVIMPVADEARNAIEEMNGKNLHGRKIHVEKSRTKRKPHVDRCQSHRLETKDKVGGRLGRRRY